MAKCEIEGKTDMYTTCISIPVKVKNMLDNIIRRGIFPSRSEAIRSLIIRSLPLLIEEMKVLDSKAVNHQFINIKNFFEERGYRISKYMNPSKSYKNLTLGNPFWEPDIIGTDKVFVNKETPEKIMYMNEEGEMKEYNIRFQEGDRDGPD